MNLIYKYKLDIADRQAIDLPVNARIIKCEEVFNDVFIWAIIKAENALEKVEFAIYGTGHPLPDDPGIYLNTLILNKGSFVIHVFCLPNPERSEGARDGRSAESRCSTAGDV